MDTNDIARTEAPVAELFDGLISGNVSDAMEHLGMRRTVIVGNQMIAPAGTRIVGPAFTVRQHWKHATTPREEGFVRHGEVSRQLARPGDVVVIDTGGITRVGSWGENHAMRCLSRGIVGMVTNGATRDADLIRQVGFPVFCKGVSPVKSLWDLETVSLNEPVNLDEVHIRGGDIVFADESGIVVVPAERAREVAELAQKIRRAEEEYQTDSGFWEQFGLGK
ncbi:RraA family protein [Ensifer sp. YR511]|uniref:RraA family protein n=1 Tax=Ensifer sp. YR511 TaxID=1855294 RepID=UPI0008805BDD|nr:RraA family protein [Ensifer sp. YR511]SDO17192.1 Regulator of RNase E activity RraA [Ensifer sp. YR511]